ncbi:Two-component sensor histidine kinase, contains HisKA and HATPase domains [Filimonas lacunae]|uniref:histidine kinase n=1 Tax=Filimonas lacunae TaxID=477680 RepID=A0A173MGP4_9BACT|nr:histidine kinase dimerization/phosphoacceptor domain -containing protein [Filimonas lacunae]BAV06794.1 sensor histidine kinase [Filimonas lacunae]SIT34343.1 Two-component sensor histidine kinase, contains HisKA and HATPase domains [Filimonas lacunae]
MTYPPKISSLIILWGCLLLSAFSCTQNNSKQQRANTANTHQINDSISLLQGQSDSLIMKKGEYLPDLEYAVVLATKAEQLCRRINYNPGIGKSLLLKAKACMEMKKTVEGAEYSRKALAILSESDNSEDHAACLTLTGSTIGDTHQEFPEKIAYYEKAAAVYRKSGNKLKEAETTQLVADLYINDGQPKRALEIMNEAFKIYHEIGYKQLQSAYTVLGTIYTELDNHVEARRYLLLAARTAEENKDTTPFMSTLYNRLGYEYAMIKDYPQAVNNFEKAYAIAQAAKDTPNILVLINNISDMKYRMGSYAASNEFLSKAVAIYPIYNDDAREAIVSIIFLNNHLALKEYAKAKVYYERVLKVRKAHDDEDPQYQFTKPMLAIYLQAAKQYQDTYKYLDSYKKGIMYGTDFRRSSWIEKLYFISDSALGKHTSAINHYQLYKAFSDSVTAVDKSRQMDELQLQYETEKKNKNIIVLESKQQAQETRLKIVIGGSIVLLLFLVLLYNRYRLKQQNNRRLERQQQEINAQNELLKKLVNDKEWLLKEIHHRVKNNLQVAISLLNMQSQHLENEDALTAIRNSQRRMYAMSLIHQRLYQTDNLGNIDMKWYISELMSFLKDSFEARDRIQFLVDSEAILLDVVQAIPIGLILNEAVTNSIKYAFTDGRKGQIRVTLHTTNAQHCLLSIADNGIGFKTESTGLTSLGMSLMEGLAGQIDGQFNLSSDQNGVTISIIFVPKRLDGQLSNEH